MASLTRISKCSREDFEFFLSTDLDMIGEAVGGKPGFVFNDKGTQWEIDPDGYTALECWHWFDTHGKTVPCREPVELSKALRSKASWNLQIKMWAEDVAGGYTGGMFIGVLLFQNELVEYCHGLPAWIFEATMRQASKLAKEKMGCPPRFARLERVHGQWWAPEMDCFDPAI